MPSRIELQSVLEKLAESRNVYFQPPPTLRMEYPAIVYSLDGIDSEHADNTVYHSFIKYQVTVIDKNPDSELIFKVASLPTCKHIRTYTADNLNHNVFDLYY